MAGLFCNATLSFPGISEVQVKGFGVIRKCDPNTSAADLSSCITYVAAKNRLDVLTCHVIDPRVLALNTGDTGSLNFVAKSADGGADLAFTGTATVIGVEGEVVFADVESPCAVTFAIVSADGTTPGMVVGDPAG